MTSSPLDVKALMERRHSFERAYTQRDIILYHLSLGWGQEPLNEEHLLYVDEKSLLVLPTFITMLGFGERVLTSKDDLDFARLVHGAQSIEMHRSLDRVGKVLGNVRITDIIDKGPDRGCIIVQETEFRCAETGEAIASARSSGFFRGDGGRGGSAYAAVHDDPVPQRAPDRLLLLPTRAEQALLFRLNGDYNRLHLDPRIARALGFSRPILHGLCSYGIACRAIVQAYLPLEPHRIGSFGLRFCSPVYPGETLVAELWRADSLISFRLRSHERGDVVADQGRATLRIVQAATNNI